MTATTDNLASILADTYTLALKTQNHHWNVEGAHFVSLHALFEEQYTELHAAADTVAERMRALGATAPGGLQAYGALTRIADAKDQMGERDRVADFAADNEAVAKTLVEATAAASQAGDEATADLLIARTQAHQKAAWMLRAVLG